jgi:hypothetical protein
MSMNLQSATTINLQTTTRKMAMNQQAINNGIEQSSNESGNKSSNLQWQ